MTKPICEGELHEALLCALDKSAPPKEPEMIQQPQSRPASPCRRILLVEDNYVNQLVALGLLEMQGHSVVIAGSGIEALRKCEAEEFDVILMDVQMPEMDGLQATARIRDLERGSARRIPILAMTAHAMAGDLEKCLTAGMDGYLTKPIQGQALYDAVDSICS
jgi:CheY-like chemotaxis protein